MGLKNKIVFVLQTKTINVTRNQLGAILVSSFRTETRDIIVYNFAFLVRNPTLKYDSRPTAYCSRCEGLAVGKGRDIISVFVLNYRALCCRRF